MDKVKTVFILCGMDFRKWISSTRIKIILLLIFLMVYNYMHGIRQFTSAVHVPVTPWSLPFLLTNFTSLIIIMFGFVFLYCDAPFLDEQQPYVVLRTGRNIFIIGQIIYVLVSSFLYTIFLFICTIVCSLPNLEISMDWGKVLKTLAFTDIGSEFNISLNVPELLLTKFDPLTVMVRQILLLWLVGCFLGFLIFTFSMILPRIFGIGCASLFILLDMFADFYKVSHGYSGSQIYFFSPISWANLSNLKNQPNEILPAFSYSCIVLIILIAILIGSIIVLFHKKAIGVLPQI